MTQPENVAEIAGREMTAAQRKALFAIGTDWTFAGKATVNASAAHSLRLYHGDLVDFAYIRAGPRSMYGRPAWRLTDLGLAVRDHLRSTEAGG